MKILIQMLMIPDIKILTYVCIHGKIDTTKYIFIIDVSV